jgi:hypothetical protein
MVDETEPLFRPEAVEYQAAQRGPGEPLRLAVAGWTSWAYWAVLAMVLAGVVVMAVVRVDHEQLIFVLVPALHDWWHRLNG